MSNIPEARRLIARALELMAREKPKFKARRQLPALTDSDKRWAKRMREQGCSIHHIAQMLGTNLGRVSEVINGKR